MIKKQKDINLPAAFSKRCLLGAAGSFLFHFLRLLNEKGVFSGFFDSEIEKNKR